MLDEFQHVIEIRDEEGGNPNALGRYQYAVESRLCPHLVTGSAVTLLTKDIIGRGSLFGRFRAEYIRGLEGYHVIELCQKLGKHHGVKVSVEMAAELARRTGGNPFYLGCIFEGARLIGMDLADFNAVNRVITYELTQGAIWSELYRQLNYYFNTINEHGITKNIFYFATRYRDEKIDPKRIAESMAHWGVNEQDVRDILLSLSRADLIDERVSGTEFCNIKDPILREFADAWARVDVEGEEWASVEAEFQRRYMQLRGEYADFKGYTGEIYVQFLMTKFNFQSVDGAKYFNSVDGAEYFNVDGQILLPKFTGPDSKKVKTPIRRLKPATPREYQIDVVGMYGLTFWLVEVKYTDQPVDKSDVEKFAAACQVAKEMYEEKEKRNLPLREEDVLPLEFIKWYVSIGGFTKPAIEYLQAHNFLYSDRMQINKLLRNFGLRELPF